MDTNLSIVENKIAVLQKEITREAFDLIITTNEEFELADSLGKRIKGLQKEIHETFDAPREAAHKAHQAIMVAMNKHLVPLQTAEKELKSKMIEYRQNEKRATEIEAKKFEEKTGIAIVPQNPTPKLAGTSFKKVWKFKIVDAKLIPAEYLMPDEAKIGKVVSAMRDSAKIPGIEVYEDEVISMRS